MSLRWPAALFGIGGALLAAAVGAQVYVSSDADFARDGWAIVVPWLLVALLGIASLVTPLPAAVTMLSIAGAISVRYAGPIAARPLVYLPQVLWGTQGVPREPWAQAIIDGTDATLVTILKIQMLAPVPLGVAVVLLVVSLWGGRTRRWDVVLLGSALVFSFVCAVAAPVGAYAAYGTIGLGNLALYLTSPGVLVLGLTWVVPVALWAVVQVGRSGYESVAAATGLVVAVLVVPVAVDLVARLLGGYTSYYAYPGDALPDYDAAASQVLDRLGFWWYVPVASVVLLVVAVIRHVSRRRSVPPVPHVPV